MYYIKNDFKDITRVDEISTKEEYPKIKEIEETLVNYLQYSPNKSISAQHFGINARIFSIKFEDDIKTFVNPMIAKKEGIHLSKEKDNIIEDVEYLIPRFNRIILLYQQPSGLPQQMQVDDETLSSLIQQNIDLLDGITLKDYGLELVPEYYEADEETQQEIIKMYLDSITKQSNDFKELQRTDKDFDASMKAIDYMTKVKTGELETIKVVKVKKNKSFRKAQKRKKNNDAKATN